MTVMSKHTPGPWHVVDHHIANRYYVSVRHGDASIGAASWDVARVTVRQTWRDQQIANAHLIAAAPDLLAALQAFADEIVPNNPNDPLWINARAAIAKATGANNAP